MRNETSLLKNEADLIAQLRAKIVEIEGLERELIQKIEMPDNNSQEDQTRPATSRSDQGNTKQKKIAWMNHMNGSIEKISYGELFKVGVTATIFVAITIFVVLLVFPEKKPNILFEQNNSKIEPSTLSDELSKLNQNLMDMEKQLAEKDQVIEALKRRELATKTTGSTNDILTVLPSKAKVTIKANVSSKYRISIDKKNGNPFEPAYVDGIELDPGKYKISVWVDSKRMKEAELTVDDKDINITIP
ncbi:hypothetical protein JCM14076_12970 [Methylosoma difficile]